MKSLSEKDPADPGADGHWFRLGVGILGYQEATRPPEEGGASKVEKEVEGAKQVGTDNIDPG